MFIIRPTLYLKNIYRRTSPKAFTESSVKWLLAKLVKGTIVIDKFSKVITANHTEKIHKFCATP